MEYTRLTGTGLDVSRICIGAMMFGEQMPEAEAIKAVHYALSEGVNFYDTANVYTGGRSEEIMGKAMKGQRDKFILATKVGMAYDKTPNKYGLSRLLILEQIEKSLKRLDTDYIDVYYMHKPDPTTPVEETLYTMDTLVRSGKVRYIGASNFAAWQICQMYYEGKNANTIRPVVTQMVYNMITRGLEQELIPFLKAYKMGLVVYNPIAAGFLTDKYAQKKQLANTRFTNDKKYADRYWNEENFQAWDEIKKIADNEGISMLDLAMRWLYSTGNVDSIITGFSKLEQLEQNLKSIEKGNLSAESMAMCDSVWAKLSGTRFNYNR